MFGFAFRLLEFTAGYLNSELLGRVDLLAHLMLELPIFILSLCGFSAPLRFLEDGLLTESFQYLVRMSLIWLKTAWLLLGGVHVVDYPNYFSIRS